MTRMISDQRFLAPRVPSRHLSRTRLLDRLDEADPVALTVLSAGAGTGKTVLLSEWARRQARPVVWLALTVADNDPRRFWRQFLEGCRAAGQDCPPTTWTAGGHRELLDAVFGGTTGPPDRLVMVLDDAHLLTDPEILEGLDQVVRRWSHRVQLLVASRHDPLLPVHRYRLSGQMRELRAAELAMTPAEGRALLAEHGVTLGEDDLRSLTRRTEGWAAGMRLAALRMENMERPGEFVALFAMDQGSVGEYLSAEVLSLLPERVQRLLVSTSFLDDVTGPLADAVTGTEGSGALLASLARANSFVIPLDPARTTFRYHKLFREVLRHLAHLQAPGQERSQYGRAAAWYRRHGDMAAALRWTVQARDAAFTRSLLVHGGLAEAFVRNRNLDKAGLRQLANAPPPADSSPAEMLDYDVAERTIAAIAADPSTAAAVLGRLHADRPDLRDADPDLRVVDCLAEVMLGREAGAFAAVDAAAERLLSEEDLRPAVQGVPGLLASVLRVQARARFGAGRPQDVEPLLERALAAVEPGMPAVELDVLSELAFVGVSAGRPHKAEDAADRAGTLLDRHPELRRPVMLDLALALRAHGEADLAGMAAAMERVRAVGPGYADAGEAATVAFVQATFLAASDELGRARELLRNSPALAGATGLFGALRDCVLATVEIALGHPRAALQTLHRHQGTSLAIVTAVVTAYAHIALADLDRAAALVRTVTTTPSPYVTRQLLVASILCEAEITHRRGEHGRTLELLDRALHLGGEDIVLPFVQATDALAPVLARHPMLAARWPAQLSAPPPTPAPSAPSTVSLPDPLTHREQAVLRLMATSMATVEIADELCLSVNTVKTHLAAIYRKLSVGRRRDAVFRARDLELL
jgi:LuxR family transcriptional regulator, maltose regulon positive regulatory protein